MNLQPWDIGDLFTIAQCLKLSGQGSRIGNELQKLMTASITRVLAGIKMSLSNSANPIAATLCLKVIPIAQTCLGQ
jgi:hypothetical protein